MARSAISSSADVGQMPGRRSAHWEFEESLLAILRRSRQEKGVIRFDSLKHLCDESRSPSAGSAAFSFVPPVFGGSDGRARALPVLARGARSVNPSESPPIV